MKILELELYTSNLQAQTKFYSEILKFPIETQNLNSATFQVGSSLLKLVYKENVRPYHFAFNIPSNQIQEALGWLEQRVKILQAENSKIQYFDFWDAHAIYFYDEDKNIVEFIARKTFNQNSDQPFSEQSIIEISEIGLPTFDIEREYKIVKNKTGMPIYSGSLERFCAVGNENGLFIMINKHLKKEWYPTKDQPFSADFKIKFLEQDDVFSFEFVEEHFRSIISLR